MQLRVWCCIIAILASINANSQQIPSLKKDNPYFRYILDHPSNNYKLIDYNNSFLAGSKRNMEFSYVISKNKIYYKPTGTGYVYEAKMDMSNGQVTGVKIDSTYFTGYNFLDYVFIKNDTIFSLGGQGFWNHNGQLRYFSREKKEWELIPIQHWFPVSTSDFVDIRSKNSKVYTYFLDNKLDNIFTNQISNSIDTILSLNLDNGEIKKLGYINPSIKSIKPDESIKIETDYGIMIFENGAIKLIDIEKNTFSIWKDIKLNNLFNSSKAEIKPIIIKDSLLIYYNYDHMDSIVLPITKFLKISNVYSPLETEKKVNKLLYLTLLILLISFSIIYIKNQKSKKSFISETAQNDDNTVNEKIILTKENVLQLNSFFDANELQLISQIILNSNRISVDQMNYILGLEKKNIQVQKKNRSSIISSINIKFKSDFIINDDLIQRIKDENDARNIIYKINDEYFDILFYWANQSTLYPPGK